MFLYINKYNIRNNLNADIYICILDIVIHADYLKKLSKEINNMLKTNMLIFYIKPIKNDPQDLHYDFFKKHFNEQDNQFIKSLNTHPKQILCNLLDNMNFNTNNQIEFISYEVQLNVIDDLIDKNYTITTYNNLKAQYNVVSKIKALFI